MKICDKVGMRFPRFTLPRLFMSSRSYEAVWQAADEPQRRRLDQDQLDSLDEELELEIDDERDAQAFERFDVLLDASAADPERQQRLRYFRELFHLQGELVKLQDWCNTRGKKLSLFLKGATLPVKAA